MKKQSSDCFFFVLTLAFGAIFANFTSVSINTKFKTSVMKRIIAICCVCAFLLSGTYALASTSSVSEPQKKEKSMDKKGGKDDKKDKDKKKDDKKKETKSSTTTANKKMDQKKSNSTTNKN